MTLDEFLGPIDTVGSAKVWSSERHEGPMDDGTGFDGDLPGIHHEGSAAPCVISARCRAGLRELRILSWDCDCSGSRPLDAIRNT